MKSADDKVLVTLSQNAAIHRIKMSGLDFNDIELVTGKLLGCLCPHCLQIRPGHEKLTRHIECQHYGPIKCKMCLAQLEDVETLQNH